jgi:hypothetical protein
MAPALRDGDQLLVRWGLGRLPALGTLVIVELPDRPVAVKRLHRVEADGRVWLEGDNTFGSTDSRELGALPAAALTGQVVARLWPRPGRIRRTPG